MHQRQYIVGILAVLGASFSALLYPYFLRLIVDGLTAAADGNPETVAVTSTQLALYALGIVGAALLSGGLMLVMRRQIVVASRQTEYELRRDLFGHLQGMDRNYFNRASTGDIMNRLTGDLSTVREMLGFGAWQIANITVGFLSAITVLFFVSWQLTLVVLAILPVMIVILTYLARLIHERHTAVQEQNSKIAAKAQQNFSGARVVKGYAIEDREIGEYKAMNDELIGRAIALVKVDGPLRSFMNLLTGVAYVLILVVGGRMILGLGGIPGLPPADLTLGQFVQFVGTFERLTFPILMTGFITGLIQRGSASWTRLEELFGARAEVTEAPGARMPAGLGTDLELSGVTLRYGQDTVLNNIDLRIPAGQVLGITGPTGAGKTTLTALLTRQIDPTEGTVRMGGVPLPELPLRELRARVAVVPQEPFLFGSSIAENIAFGLDNDGLQPVETGVSVLKSRAPLQRFPAPDMERVRAAARLAGLSGDVEEFPEGYDTLLGERGITLSGGQRQRTALARAIACEAPVLILDDSLSAVDTETESRILAGLKEVSQGRTVVLSSHRVSTLRHADHIVVLEDGRIVEQGSHDGLLQRGGHYAELERQQRLGADLEQEDTALSVAGGEAARPPSSPGARGETITVRPRDGAMGDEILGDEQRLEEVNR